MSKKNMKIAIVYQKIPDSTDCYVLNVTDEEYVWIKTTHMRYINTDGQNDNCHKLSTFLQGKAQHKLNEGSPVSMTGIDALIITGFLL